MKKLTLILLVSSLIIISGCASDKELTTLVSNSNAIAAMQMQAALSQTETITLKCGENSNACKGLEFSYTDPRDRQKVTGQKVTGTNDVIVGVAPSAVSIVGWVSGTIAASKIMSDVMSNAGGNNITTHNTTAVNGNSNNVTATTAANKTTSNSQDSSQVTSTDNSDNSDNSQQNQTATPTVVTTEKVVPTTVVTVNPSYPPVTAP